MPKSPMVEVSLEVSPSLISPAVSEPDAPFHVLLIGDFSGRASRGVTEPINGRRPVPIDRDEFDDVLRSLNVHLKLPLGDEGASAEVRITSLDDFHPDALYATQPLFAELRRLRMELEQGTVTPDRPSTPRNPQAPTSLLTGSLLDAIAEAAETTSVPVSPRPADPLLTYVQDLVSPHLEHIDPAKVDHIARLEESIAGAMRSLLHQPLFQSLESSWRALHWLVRHTETGPRLRLFLLDASKGEILADLATASDLRTTGLFRALVTQPVRDEPWALIGADLFFRPWIDEVELLARLAMIADQAGAPVLAGADPSVTGVKSIHDLTDPAETEDPDPAWGEIRRLPEAARVGLALPRLLMRLPYGAATSPAETFAFEEMPAPDHGAYLWANPMYACVQLIARAFTIDGWEMQPGRCQELDPLPLHTYEENGEHRIKPCAEVFLTPEAIHRLLGAGLIPLFPGNQADAVRVGPFQSVADPPAPLAGRWA